MSPPDLGPGNEQEESVAAEVLPYATPIAALGTARGAWRDESLLVTNVQAVLPQRCVKCNAPSDGSYRLRNFQWLHPAYALLILAGVLVYVIVALLVTKKATLQLGLCRKHHRRRLLLLTITWLLALAALPVFIAGIILADEMKNDALTFVGLIAMLAIIIAAVITGVSSRILTPKRIDERFGLFKGCSPEFLAELPSAR